MKIFAPVSGSRRRWPVAIVGAVVLLAAACGAARAHAAQSEQISLSTGSGSSRVRSAPISTGPVTLPNGRTVTPVGQLFRTGPFSLGVAVSPDGRLVVTTNDGQGFGLNGGFNSYCGQGQNLGIPGPCPYIAADPAEAAHVGNPATPTADESLTVLNTATGSTSTVTAVPTSYDPSRFGQPGTFNYFYVGLAFSPDGRHLYASGGGNNAVYDFSVNDDVVSSPPAHTWTIPASFAGPTTGPLDPNYPIYGQVTGFTKGLTVTPDGRYVLVAHEFNNTLDILDTTTGSYNQVLLDANPGPLGGFYPDAVAIAPSGQTAYVSGQGMGVIAQIQLAGGSGALERLITVGDHPTSLAMSPDGSQLFVANTNSDTLSVIDTATGSVGQTVTLHATAGEQLGSSPNGLAISPDGRRLYATLAGDDAVAVLARDGQNQWQPQGLVPTGWYPSAVATSPDGSNLYVASAKGYGSEPAPITTTYHYDGNNMPGLLQALPAPAPGSATLSDWTRTVRANIASATAGGVRSPNNPIPTQPGGYTPITHVIEIVRENRTFDQVLGDLPADQGRPRSGPAGIDAQPAYVTFGRAVTPNAHALLGDPLPGTTDPAFASSDRFFSDGEASIQGHWWTAAGNVTDYVEKAWPQYYSPRGHVNDPESTVTQPHNCTIFQSALQRQIATGGSFTARDYGELIGLSGLSLPGVNLGFPGPVDVPNPCAVLPNASFDPKAVNDETLDTDNRQTAQEFLTDIGLNADGSPSGAPHAFLRNFSYLTLSGDHTGGLSFAETPRSRVAENDAGLGIIVQAISHSPYWANTVIFVMEDDSQDGLDHVDGHRNLLYVISPWTKHRGADGKPGYLSHHHYSQASVMATIENLTGLPHLSTYDQQAEPLYDLFQNKNELPQLTPADLQAFNVEPLPSFVPEPSSCYSAAPPAGCHPTVTNPAVRAELVSLSHSLDTTHMDAAGPGLELVDWLLSNPASPVPRQLIAECRANKGD